MSKYSLSALNFNTCIENVCSIVTTSNGDFLVEDELNLTPEVTVKPGMYRAVNNSALVHLGTTKPDKIHIVEPFNNDGMIVDNPEGNIKFDCPSDHMNREEKRLLLKTLKRFKGIFLQENQKFSFTHEIKHAIKTTDEIPIHQKAYKYSYHLRDEVQKEIDKLLDNGIIRESSSQWTSPIWVVPKKNDNSGKKKYRIVIDYRKLNVETPADRYPIPEVSEILDRLGKAQYFSVIDLASGFHQIEVDPADVPKTAFNVDHGKYEFVRMPI